MKGIVMPYSKGDLLNQENSQAKPINYPDLNVTFVTLMAPNTKNYNSRETVHEMKIFQIRFNERKHSQSPISKLAHQHW